MNADEVGTNREGCRWIDLAVLLIICMALVLPGVMLHSRYTGLVLTPACHVMADPHRNSLRAGVPLAGMHGTAHGLLSCIKVLDSKKPAGPGSGGLCALRSRAR